MKGIIFITFILAVILISLLINVGYLINPSNNINLQQESDKEKINSQRPLEILDSEKQSQYNISPTLNQERFSLQYPNSEIIQINGSISVFESSDDPQKITDWYKEKIRSMGLNINTFVQTKTNNSTLNKLVGKSSSQEIKVDIVKPNNSQKVRIDLFINNLLPE